MTRAYSLEIKNKVRWLRSCGKSLGEISIKTKIPKNTISGWVKGINLTKTQEKRLKQKISASSIIGRTLAIKANRQKIEKWKAGIRQKVKKFKELATQNQEIGRLICGLLYLL